MKRPLLLFRLWLNRKLEQILFWRMVIIGSIIAFILVYSLLWTLTAAVNIIREDRKHQHEHNV